MSGRMFKAKKEESKAEALTPAERLTAKINALRARIDVIMAPHLSKIDSRKQSIGQVREQLKSTMGANAFIPPPPTPLGGYSMSEADIAKEYTGGTLYSTRQESYHALMNALEEAATLGRLSARSDRVLRDCRANELEQKQTPVREFFKRYLRSDAGLVALFDEVHAEIMQANTLSRLIENAAMIVSHLMETTKPVASSSSSSSSSAGKSLADVFTDVVTVLGKIEANSDITTDDVRVLEGFNHMLKSQRVDERFGVQGKGLISGLDEIIEIGRYVTSRPGIGRTV